MCCFFSVVIFTLFLFTHGQYLQRSEAANSKFLPVVINTWGPPFTNATAEGKPKITFEVIRKSLKSATETKLSYLRFLFNNEV